LLTFNCINFVNLIPFLVAFSFSWVFFLKNNFFYIRYNANSNEVLKNSNVLKKFHFKIFLNFILLIITLLVFSVFFYSGVSETFWWSHLFINNFNHQILILVLFLSLLLNLLILNINATSNVNNADYYFSILNLSIIIPVFFLSNSLYNFIFFLEMVSILIFYKFSVSRFWYKSIHDSHNKKNLLERFVSRNYLNILFYQYWVNFFSSVIIIVAIINVMYLYGSTDWLVLNFINKIDLNLIYFKSTTLNFFIFTSMMIGFFLKIGVSPLHLFKIEIYKGIPFISIFFYTTFYFTSYFIFFSMFVFLHLNSLKFLWVFAVAIIIILGMVYLISLLFDTNFTKAFFAYSTIANSFNFLILLISSI